PAPAPASAAPTELERRRFLAPVWDLPVRTKFTLFTGLVVLAVATVGGYALLAVREVASGASTADDVTPVLLGLAAVAMLLIGVVGAGFGWAVTSGLRHLRRSVHALAEGDLTVRPVVVCRDDIGHTALALCRAQDRLRGLVGAAVESAEYVSDSADSLASRTTRVTDEVGRTSQQSTVVAAAADQVSANVR